MITLLKHENTECSVTKKNLYLVPNTPLEPPAQLTQDTRGLPFEAHLMVGLN